MGTHPDPRCVAACVWYSATLEEALHLDARGRIREAMESGLTTWDSHLLRKLRLGHHWPGIPTTEPFVDLLDASGEVVKE